MADVEMGGGLVEQQDLGLLGEAAGERRQLTLAGREGAEGTTREVLDAGLGQGTGHRLVVMGGEGAKRPAVRVAAEGHAVRHLEGRGSLFLGRHQGDGARPGVPLPRVERPALEANLPGPSGQEARHRPQERRLAGGVRSHEGQGLARAQGQAGSVQDRRAPALHHELARLEKEGQARSSLARSAIRK